jgi:autotransporter family porin
MRRFCILAALAMMVSAVSWSPVEGAEIKDVNGPGGSPSVSPVSNPVVKVRYFSTLPPGARLPSDAECAASVKPRAETRPHNEKFNNTRGRQRLAANFFRSSDPRANSEIAIRVTGNYTGTTDEILQWAACKWGIDENVVRAAVAAESAWGQGAMGDWSANAKRCAPGHGIGADGRRGLCPESWG